MIPFCIRNPFLTLSAALALALAGFWSWRHVPVDALPDLSDNQVIVWAEWPGKSPQDMDQQVRDAQHRLAALRSQQEEVERQKLILENLRQKQDRFVSGKKEITEKLDRGLRSIADDLEDARRRVEDLAITQQDFQERLDALKTFLPERWQRSQQRRRRARHRREHQQAVWADL